MGSFSLLSIRHSSLTTFLDLTPPSAKLIYHLAPSRE